MLREAHRLGLKVVTELVINHTSDQHPWFQAARRAPPGSPERDFYVWSDTDQKYLGTRIIFIDTETSNWAWDPVAKAYYWHRFFSHQPDLNFDNPRVMDAVLQIMRFWLDMGVDGFRLDAIPYLVEREGTNNENLPETHAVIKQLRAAIDADYRNRFLLAEANQWPEDVREYFGDGDECHMAYHFPLMPRIYMSIAQEDRYPITEIMQQTPDIPDSCQWAIFLRNHDELTLEMVTSKERDYMYTTYAADVRARINLGIRRRLAPLMENDHDRIKLMNSLLLSMPGSPILYYGDEIGMGDNVFIGDRNGVRTPMQWSPDRNAGFSRADPQRLYLPPIMDPDLRLSVDQRRSTVARSELAAELDQAHARGAQDQPGVRARHAALLDARQSQDPRLPARVRRGQHPMRREPVAVGAAGRTQPRRRSRAACRSKCSAAPRFRPSATCLTLLTLSAYGFYWFNLTTDAEAPSWHEQIFSIDERPVLVLFDGWSSLFRDRVVPWRIAMAEKTRLQFETDTLPRFIETQRWYAAKGTAIERARIVDQVIWQEGKTSWLRRAARCWRGRRTPRATSCRSRSPGRSAMRIALRNLSTAAVAKVRQQANVGVMGDAFADELFCRALVSRRWPSRREIATAQGKLQFRPTAAFAQLAGSDFAALHGRPSAGLQLEYRGRDGRTADVEGLSQIARRRESRTRDGPLPHRGRALSQLRAAGGRVGVCGQRRRAEAARAAASLHRQSGRRLDLLARIPAAPSRGASHRARHRRAARQCARGVSRR